MLSGAELAMQCPGSRFNVTLRSNYKIALTVFYLVSVLIHFLLLLPMTATPLIFPDEVHYAVTADSILAGKGYQMRGAFSDTVPPLQSVFIALGYWLGGDRRIWVFLLSILVVCASVFPAAALGRWAGLSRRQSLLFGFAVSLQPHTLYAGTYMSETLQFPLFLTAAWLALRLFERASLNDSMLLGLLLGLMALTRYATATFVLSIVAAVGLAWLLKRFLSSFKRLYLPAFSNFAIAFGIYAVIQASWWMFKAAHNASILGLYATSHVNRQYASVSLVTAYVGDVFLAAGPVSAAPFIFGLLALWHAKRSGPALLIVCATMILVITTAVFDGGLTSFLRERYYMYVIPLVALIAVFGASGLEKWPRWKVSVVALAGSCICLACVMLYAFPVPSLLESPWSFLFGAWRFPGHPAAFDKQYLAAQSFIAITFVAAAMMLRSVSIRSVMLVSLLFWNGASLGSSAVILGRYAQAQRQKVDSLLTLLPPDLARKERVVMAGKRVGFEFPSAQADAAFVGLNSMAGIDPDSTFRMEVMKHLDVRVLDDPAQLTNRQVWGKFLVSATPFRGLPLVNTHEGFHLYRLPEEETVIESQFAKWEKTIFLPATMFSTLIGVETKKLTCGNGDPRPGYLEYGPYSVLAPGEYEAAWQFTPAGGKPYTFDVVQSGVVLAATTAATAPILKFITHSQQPIEFRTFGPGDTQSCFAGVSVKSLK